MSDTTAAAEATRKLLATLWQKNLPTLQARLAQLDAAAEAETLTPELRSAAITDAHKLAGSLGMFGYPEGTAIAREIEQLLEAEGAPEKARLHELTTALRSELGL